MGYSEALEDDEIEITPAMIEAGIEVLCSVEALPEWGTASDLVQTVFKEMLAVHRAAFTPERIGPISVTFAGKRTVPSGG